ncbi:MAG: class II glutamine amidotransferase [Actinomycetia bacterium]|nr:class II glutamine amidotransferase [Actinomycetes bacterium]MCH9701201.1 class II glutamine amidotransferase [Actinomycetes bacterium]MCH9762061.1 class II glutamine amidotransferase [Actinomycetes bacterium]
MCRHLGWLGAPVSVASLLLDQPSGLLVQSYAPRRQQHGLMNADGWGVGFFDPGRQESGASRGGSDGTAEGGTGDAVARRWRSAAPLWGDTSFASVAPALISRCVVAAVRSASVGMAIEPSASAPFTDGIWLLSHNGIVDRTVLPASVHAESTNDSALLAALIFERGLDALADTVAEVATDDPNARLNILAANGSRLVATTWGDTLSVLCRDDGVVLASEPYDDDPAWQDIPDRHLVEVTDMRVQLTQLEGPR